MGKVPNAFLAASCCDVLWLGQTNVSTLFLTFFKINFGTYIVCDLHQQEEVFCVFMGWELFIDVLN